MQYTEKEAFAIAKKIAKGQPLTADEQNFVEARVNYILANEVL